MVLVLLLTACSLGPRAPSSPVPSPASNVVISSASVKRYTSNNFNGTYRSYFWSVILYNKGNAHGRVKVSVCAPPGDCTVNLGESNWLVLAPDNFTSVTGDPVGSVDFPLLHQALVMVWQDNGVLGTTLVDSWQVNIEPVSQ